MDNDEFEVGDCVATFIEGPIVGRREEIGKPTAYKVRFSDAEGVTRERWLFGDEIYLDCDCCGGGDEEVAAVAVASAALN